MPSDVEKFQKDLLKSVKQMRRGQAARVTKVKHTTGAARMLLKAAAKHPKMLRGMHP